MIPERYVNVEAARRRFGERVDRLGAMLWQGDPLADEAAAALTPMAAPRRDALMAALARGERPAGTPDALVRLFEPLRHVPFWVDYERCDRGGTALLKAGILGGFVLAFRSLVMGYCSPAGNKPLAFSGQLRTAASRRLSETSRFVEAVSLPGGLRLGAPGFLAAAKVRLMHAQVRRLLSNSPRWNARVWGVPINQLDMAGTVMLFSLVVVDGLRLFGVPLSDEQAGDMLHLWRYAGYLLGVREELLCATETEARTLWDVITSTQALPDEDSVRLAEALMQNPRTRASTPEEAARADRIVDFAYGMSRYLLGDTYADHLKYPKTPWRFVGPVLRPLLSGATQLLRVIPGVDELALNAGMNYWRRAVSLGLGREEARFDMPRAVPGA